MSKLSINITDPALEHLAEGGETHGPELLKLLDQEVEAFDTYLQSRAAPLFRQVADKYEKAAVRSFLYYKLTDDYRRKKLQEAERNVEPSNDSSDSGNPPREPPTAA